MAYTTINKSTDYFNTILYTGTGNTGQGQTGVGFQPDMTWIKCRSHAQSHMVQDAVRGATKQIFPNTNGAETSWTNGLTSFDSDGFTVAGSDEGGASSKTYVAWNWKANGAGSANTDGAISSTVSVNTTAGISLTKYTGGGAASTVGHGLGVAPKVVLIKDLTSANDWRMYHESLGNQSQVSLSQNSAADSGNTAMWNSTSPTSTVFSIGTHGNVSTNNSNYMAYCFAEKKGFSKFGSYTGNGDADGSFIYTGFKPAMVIIKLYSTGSENWRIFDNKRIGYNPNNYKLYPSLNNTEGTSDLIDLYSNGFKPRTTSIESNGSGNGYIYMAFGQSLVGSNNVPCTAR
tara:strand:+ start:1458 stop:2492 length:1035 start_codon:yes stop_codon:yes gene_type:complete